MRTILFILQKEILQIVRNRAILPIIFVVPLVQLLVLVHAATFEMKDIKMVVVDNDLSTASRELETRFSGSPFFKIEKQTFSIKEAENEIEAGKADMILRLASGFESKLIREGKADVQLIVNAINGNAAGLAYAYAANVISGYNKEIIIDWINNIPQPDQIKTISTTYSFWYNPELNYKNFMVPGILVLLVTIIGMFLSAINLVREKEIGTIEQINVTPIRKTQFLIGKLLPFWFIALFDLAFGLVIGKLTFDIPIIGSLWLIFGVAATYLVVVLGMGLFVSTISQTQQQAMFISWFILLVFILMSGLFTPVESMPPWAQMLNKLNPLAYFIRMMRMIIMKGSGFADIRTNYFIVLGMGIVVMSMSVMLYRKKA